MLPTEVTRRLVRSEVPVDWAAERPRRGRPPKRRGPEQGTATRAA
jgi:hypothetical protein